jgi:hypothetical protein
VIAVNLRDVATSWNSGLNTKMRTMLDTGDRATFNRNMRYATMVPGLRRTLTLRGRPYPHTDWFDLFTAVRQYRLEPEIAVRITTPLLITSPEGEQFWPGQSQQLADLLPGRADLVAFTAAEGANFHCQPQARLLTDQRMFDWLADQLARALPTRQEGDPAPVNRSARTDRQHRARGRITAGRTPLQEAGLRSARQLRRGGGALLWEGAPRRTVARPARPSGSCVSRRTIRRTSCCCIAPYVWADHADVAARLQQPDLLTTPDAAS